MPCPYSFTTHYETTFANIAELAVWVYHTGRNRGERAFRIFAGPVSPRHEYE
jgi:hypothetical protein